MKTKLFIFLFLILQISTTSFAESNSATSIVIKGLDAYAKGGPEEAVNVWIKDSGLEGNKSVLARVNDLKLVEGYWGNFESYEILKDYKFSERVHIVLFVINYEKGPMFCRFQSYLSKSGDWVTTYFDFDSDVFTMFSDKLIYGE
jgi:hypothetical protein